MVASPVSAIQISSRVYNLNVQDRCRWSVFCSTQLRVPVRPARLGLRERVQFGYNTHSLCPQFSGRVMSFMTVTSMVGLNITLRVSLVSSTQLR